MRFTRGPEPSFNRRLSPSAASSFIRIYGSDSGGNSGHSAASARSLLAPLSLAVLAALAALVTLALHPRA